MKAVTKEKGKGVFDLAGPTLNPIDVLVPTYLSYFRLQSA